MNKLTEFFALDPEQPAAWRGLHALNFDNSYAQLPQHFYSRQSPTPLPAPYLVSFNAHAAALIDLDPASSAHPEFVEYFTGNRLLPGAQPLSMLYAGHQFGYYVPQLGDGRAILLGEVRNRNGELWDVQLKGAGLTPYSRQGDGRAVLRSTIREYLCCEAMHGLNIPTTRALCITGSDEEVYRERIETAAVLTRLSPSHVRFGSFEVFFYRKQHEHIATLADYVIARHFPHWQGKAERYLLLLEQAVQNTAKLMAQWQAVGFSHGVMNTDNMSILGITLDYGPFGFMEAYDPNYICNHSDPNGRYAFDQQPDVGLWNLACLARALSPLIPEQDAEAVLAQYARTFNSCYMQAMGEKLGLRAATQADVPLIGAWLQLLRANRLDYTNTFRALGQFDSTPSALNAVLRDQMRDRAAFDVWAADYRARLQQEGSTDAERKQRMDRANPKYILRNYLAQLAIERAEREREFSEIDTLLVLLRQPYAEQPGMQRYAELPPGWASSLEVSCSS